MSSLALNRLRAYGGRITATVWEAPRENALHYRNDAAQPLIGRSSNTILNAADPSPAEAEEPQPTFEAIPRHHGDFATL